VIQCFLVVRFNLMCIYVYNSTFIVLPSHRILLLIFLCKYLQLLISLTFVKSCKFYVFLTNKNRNSSLNISQSFYVQYIRSYSERFSIGGGTQNFKDEFRSPFSHPIYFGANVGRDNRVCGRCFFYFLVVNYRTTSLSRIIQSKKN